MEAAFDFFARHAASVGRLATPVRRPVFLPRLPEANGLCLGVIRETGTGNYTCVTFGNENEVLFTGGRNGFVRRRDLQIKQVVWEQNLGQLEINDLAINHEGTRLLAAHQRGIAVIDAVHGTVIWDDPGSSTLRARWHPRNARVCAYGGFDRRLHVRDTLLGTELFNTDVRWNI